MKKIFILFISILLVLGLLYILSWVIQPGVTYNYCGKLKGKIVNGEGCESGWESLGKIKPNLDGSQLLCPCICCVQK